MRVVGGSKDPIMDLAVFGLAEHFIGNCVSSYTAFAIRDRQARGKSVSFWGLE